MAPTKADPLTVDGPDQLIYKFPQQQWKVDHIAAPPGASQALKEYVALADQAIQTGVKLLGLGRKFTPPDVGDVLVSSVRDDLGKGSTAKEYKTALAKVTMRKSQLASMDDNVAAVTLCLSDAAVRVLREIKSIVADLKA
ncbi:MAG: hypothetical protein HOQ24_03585, partial [Mycobacteriaceae bacterium]|nr:hypothetical protein [Mycobacteriaceae bacterium]